MSGLDPIYINALTSQVEAVNSCELLQDAASRCMKALNDQLASYQAMIEQYAPLLALLQIPENPNDAVTWIKNYIENYLTQQFAPALEFPAQVIALTAAIENLASAIQSKASQFESCSIAL